MKRPSHLLGFRNKVNQPFQLLFFSPCPCKMVAGPADIRRCEEFATLAYQALKQLVPGRGVPPDAFLDELISWGRFAPSDIFLPPDSGTDVYASVLHVLGPWGGLLHRR